MLREARRVLKPGGRFFCLEFSRVQVAALTPLYDAWSFKVLPRLGALVAGDEDSYRYLAESIRTFPDQETSGRHDARGRACARQRCATCPAASPRSIRGGGYEPGRQARPADHLRRHRRLQGAGTHPPAAQARLRRDLRADPTTARQFVTPLSLQALSESKVYTDLFSLTDESEMGHIQLSRAADLVVVAPATANILAKMAAGLADDLASTVLLATDKPVLVAPAMNVRMWLHPATQANMATLRARGVQVRRPGRGRDGLQRIRPRPPGRTAGDPRRDRGAAGTRAGRCAGRHALVTSGPTHEPIDPVRYIANRSSGRQGHAIAAALAALGARVTLVSGPVSVPDPPGVTVAPCRNRARRCWPPANRRCRPTSRCSPPPSPTGAWRRRVQRQDQEAAGRRPAGAGAGAEPGHPGHHRRRRPATGPPGGRLRRRDRRL